ncbi:hypothetical protein C8R47DRAFT_290289 [Mycena vitilis]|nr:hypothetical protein C8R47DRAFT_290289 [Mycena vitilis]
MGCSTPGLFLRFEHALAAPLPAPFTKQTRKASVGWRIATRRRAFSLYSEYLPQLAPRISSGVQIFQKAIQPSSRIDPINGGIRRERDTLVVD